MKLPKGEQFAISLLVGPVTVFHLPLFIYFYLINQSCSVEPVCLHVEMFC